MSQRFQEEPNSMIGRYLGLYRISFEGTSRLFFVMLNTNRSGLKATFTFDMKGSSRHRNAKPDESVKKDNDWWEDTNVAGGLDITEQTAAKLARIHEGDVDLLCKYRIMDYSLLVQIHDSTSAAKKQEELACVPLLGGSAMQSQSGASKLPVGNPGFGIKSADGRKTYFFGLIDILVPYDTFPEPKYLGLAYPQAQYIANNVVTCGKADLAARVPPDYYRDRQVEMFSSMCGLSSDYE
jgi:hypothetical protein